MKILQYPKTLIALVLILAAGAYSVSWTHTPYGRLDYPTALSLHLLTFSVQHQPDPDYDLSFTLPVNLAFTLASILPGESVHETRDIHIPGPDGDIAVRIYWPKGFDAARPVPVIVYYHGGGFLLGSVELFDALTRSLANRTNSIVVSVDYRLAPAHPWPAAIDDAYAAVVWASRYAQGLGGNPRQIVVAGDSAGGNIAAVVALKARDQQAPTIAAQLLYYPVVDLTDRDYPSIDKFGRGGYGSTPEMSAAFHDGYLRQAGDRANPYISPLYAQSLADLPPALVATAGFDRLTDSAMLYERRLRDAGVPVTALHYPSTIHGFMSVLIFSQREQALQATHAFLNSQFQ